MGRKKIIKPPKDEKNNLSIINDNKWINKNKFSYEKSIIYYNFFKKLFKTIQETYLGKDIIIDKIMIYNHFKWCFDNTVTDFNNMHIIYINDSPLFQYFYYFFENSFYKKPEILTIENINTFFKDLFDFEVKKSPLLIDQYKYIYKLYDLSFEL